MKPGWSSRTRFLWGLLIVVLLGIGLVLDRTEADRQRLDRRAQVQAQLEDLRDQLQSQLNADLQLVRGLASVIVLVPDIDQPRFEQAVQPLLDARTHLRNVVGAPDLVVRMVAPVRGNEAVLGLDYRRNADQRQAALLARDMRQVVLAGPLQLVQGGTGVIARMPVFLPNPGGQERFWGLVSAVIDSDRLFADVGLAREGAPIRVAIRGTDGAGSAGRVFFGDPALFGRQPALTDVELPAGAWQLAAEPSQGWTAAAGGRWGLRAAYAAAAGLVLALFGALARGLRSVSRAREQAEAARRQVAAVLEGAPDAMLLVDAEGCIVSANSQAQAVFGRSRAEIEGHAVERLMPEARRHRHAQLRQAYQGSASEAHPFRTTGMLGLRADGTEMPIEIMLSPLHIDGRDMVVASVRDITERRSVEAELERHRYHLEAQVEQRTAQLAAAKEAAESANLAKTRFLANISHEIRTPLNAISGMSFLIRRSGVNDEQSRWLDTLETASRHLLGVIDSILDLSKIESGRFDLVLSRIDLRAVVEGVAALVRESARAKGLDLRLELPDELPAVRGDVTRLQQALLNYAANAVRFTAQGGVTLGLRVTERSPQDCVLHFEVTDTGPGIDEATLARLFRPFEQADNTSTRRHGGTGLGLVITRRLAQLMGGDAGVDSQPGAGSRFWFTARLALEMAEDEALEPGPVVVAPRRVLLAEDDPVNRLIASSLLQGLGHEVDMAEDGERALAMASENPYDLILMDVQMPSMDGLEATRRIRVLPAHARTRIVAITANAFEQDREACARAGMDGFLTKPIDPDRLRRVVAGMA